MDWRAFHWEVEEEEYLSGVWWAGEFKGIVGEGDAVVMRDMAALLVVDERMGVNGDERRRRWGGNRRGNILGLFLGG